jgi:hypothetical protein
MPPILHFGYFDHAALAAGRLSHRSDSRTDKLPTIRQEAFGPLPGREMPGLGFFDYYGVLSCECPSAFSRLRLPVARVLQFVDQSGCDVVYAYNGEFQLLSRAELPASLDPERILPEKWNWSDPFK